MTLTWKGAPGNIIARGDKGIYTIQSLAGGQHILQGIGYDDRPIPDFGFLSKEFGDLDEAQDYAFGFDSEADR